MTKPRAALIVAAFGVALAFLYEIACGSSRDWTSLQPGDTLRIEGFEPEVER